MRSSYRIFRVFGISVELHITFILLLLILLIYGWLSEGLIAGLRLVVLFLLLFTIVLMHELSHSAVALLCGIKVPRITLLPIGGAANIEVPEKPHIELIMAVAGPLFNIVLAVFVAILMFFLIDDPLAYVSGWDSSLPSISRTIFSLDGLLIFLLYINVVLAVFNLLPIFPMDGGRVFRAILALFMDYMRATSIAVTVGQYLSILMVVYGVFGGGGLWLTLIGVIIYIVSGQELKIVRLRHVLFGLSVGDAAIRGFRYVHESTTIKDFFERVARPQIQYYPVVDDSGSILGMFCIDYLKDVKSRDFGGVTVGEFTGRSYASLDAVESLPENILKLMESDYTFVTEGDRIVGYLTPAYLTALARYKGIREGMKT